MPRTHPSRLTALRALVDRVVPSGAIVLASLTLGGYVMGLVRDRAFARTYGAGADLDAYNAAFVLPELLLDVLVASGLTAPFVPVYARLARESREAADAFGRSVTTAATGVMVIVSLILFVAAPATTAVIAPGFTGPQAEQYVGLFRVMCLTPVLFAASIAIGELLVAHRRFAWFAVAPLLYNGGIVLATVLLADRLGIFAAAVGAVAGAVAHLAIRLAGLLRTDVRLRPQLAIRTAEFREFIRLMLPKMAAQPVEPLIFLFFTQLASTLGEGSVSSLSFARNFQSVPVSLIGASFSLAVFPQLSAIAAAGDRRGFRRLLGANLATIAALTVAASLALALLGTLAIEVLLSGGAFDAEDVARTAMLVTAFAVSVPFESLTYPLARGCYATRNTAWPVLGSVVALGVIVAVTPVLAAEVGLVAIPVGYAIGMAAKAAVIGFAVLGRVRSLAPADEEVAPAAMG